MKWINQSEEHDSLLYVVFNLLKESNIPYDKNIVEEKFKSHYSYPSVLSLNDILKEIGLDVITYRLDNLSLFKTISFPVISLLNDKKTFILIKSINNNRVQYLNPKEGLCTENFDIFISKWHNVITEISTISDKKNNSCIDIASRISNITFNILLALSISFYIFFIFFFSNDWLNIIINTLITTTSSLGCILSLLLLNIEYQSNNPYISKFCHVGNKFNCKTVATSSFSILWGNIHLYECVGLFFSGILIFSLLANIQVNNNSYYTFLFFTFICSIPFVIASLYQQILIVKKYCIFCLGIDFILILNTFILYNYIQSYHIVPSILYMALISFSLPLFIWYYLRNNISALFTYKDLKFKYNRFLYNPAVINSIIINNEGNYKFTKWNNEFIILKNDCNTNLILILSITCKYCAQKFLNYMELKDNNDYLVNFIFRFWFYTDDTISKTVMRTIAASLVNKDQEKASTDLTYWYKCFLLEDSLEQAFKQWIKNVNKPNINVNEVQINQYLDSNLEWYKQMGFTSTPIEILNEKVIPNDIEIKYLKYLLISKQE